MLAALDRAPFLLVLDGLERILIVYPRLDAARLADDAFDRRTANVVAGAYGLPASGPVVRGPAAASQDRGPTGVRSCASWPASRASRVPGQHALHPADLQGMTGAPCPGCTACSAGAERAQTSGTVARVQRERRGETLLPLFAQFERHPCYRGWPARSRRYRPAPGDFERWRRDHPGFSPADLPLMQVRSHVLEYALRGLDEKALEVLRTIAAFRMPARYDTLAALLIESPSPAARERAGVRANRSRTTASWTPR